MEQKCYGMRNIASFPAGMLPVLPSCHVTLTPCCIVPWQQSVATRLIQIACCYGANIRSDLRVTTRTRLTRGNFTRRLGYRRAKCPAVALWWIIHELNCFICGLIIFTVVTDQHSAAISVQAVDDVGYSLVVPCHPSLALIPKWPWPFESICHNSQLILMTRDPFNEHKSYCFTFCTSVILKSKLLLD